MVTTEWEAFVQEFEGLQHDLQAIKRINRYIDEQQQFIVAQVEAIQELQQVIQEGEYQTAEESNIQYIWEAYLHFTMLYYDIFLTRHSLQAQRYFTLHQSCRFPLLGFLAIQCHEFLNRFNSGIFHDRYWKAIFYIETMVKGGLYQSRLQQILREFNQGKEEYKKQLATIRNIISHRPVDILEHYHDTLKVNEDLVLSLFMISYFRKGGLNLSMKKNV